LYLVCKRFFDVLLSVFVIAFTLPLQLLIAFGLFVELRNNPIFIQERALAFGKNHFRLLKFRTIKRTYLNSIQCDYNSNDFLTKQISFNLTPFAKFLRKTGLDELLQIYNVLIGQMSLVGPRPLMLEDLQTIKNNYNEQHLIRGRLKSKPGITGLWQVSGNRELGIENLFGLDLFYEENKSFKLDVNIFYSTLRLLFRTEIPDGVVSRTNAINEIYVVSQYNFLTDHGKYLKHKKNNLKSYSIGIPQDWWYASDTYTSTEKKKSDIIEKVDKKLPSKKIFTN
jgi:exopolysaccharide production protein ExoY